MKRFVAFLLIAVMAISLVSCRNSEPEPTVIQGRESEIVMPAVTAGDGSMEEIVIPAKASEYAEPPIVTIYTPEGEHGLGAVGYIWYFLKGEEMIGVLGEHWGRPYRGQDLKTVDISSHFAEQIYMPVKSGEGYAPTDEVGYLLKLDWQLPPDEIKVTCWQEAILEGKNANEEMADVLDISAFYAKSGAYVYEIQVTWKEREEGNYGYANYYVHIRTPSHKHQLAEKPQTVKDPFVGYCGNTLTTLYVGGKSYAFMYGNSVKLTDILLNLDYKRGMTCRCMAEYTMDTEFGLGYEVNLTEGFARCEKGQAALTQEQVETISEIVTWAVTTDCAYPPDN